jgi:hypothetical protein
MPQFLCYTKRDAPWFYGKNLTLGLGNMGEEPINKCYFSNKGTGIKESDAKP